MIHKTEIGEDITVEVEFSYQPFEAMTHDYPGCPEAVIIDSVRVKGVDIMSLLSEEVIDSLEMEILEPDEEF